MESNIALQVENLTKRFGALTAVKNLSLTIHAGEVFGILGPNGAGKTTSIKMMCGLLKPDGGRVLVQGIDIAGSGRSSRLRVGVCPQEIVLWSKLTCLEQLVFIGQMYGLPSSLANKRSLSLLEELGLVEKKKHLAKTLSGGMQRRLNLAMALVHDPEIVVLDEPEAGLDPQGRVRVRDYLRSLARQKTIILTTHNMDEADRVADRLAIIDHGELLVQGTPEELKHSRGQGDVVEISLLRPEDSARACEALRITAGEAEIIAVDGMLTIRALDAVNLLPAILARLAGAGVQPGEVHLRENTLEDVFIQLTGRRLRE